MPNQILSVFSQPARDKHTYVVKEGMVKDIACYRSTEITGTEDPRKIAAHGDKLTEAQFNETLGAWDYKRDGLTYRQ